MILESKQTVLICNAAQENWRKFCQKVEIWLNLHENEVAMALSNDLNKQLTHQSFHEG